MRLGFSLVVFLIAALSFIAMPLFASEAPSVKESKPLADFLLDNVFLLTILFIFLSAVITTILGARARDRCLKDFHQHPVLLELEKDYKLVWGKLHLFSNALELRYKEPFRDADGHIETSFILYKDEWPGLVSIYRWADELDEESLKSRKKAIRRTYKPSIFRLTGRSIKNLVNTLRDAVSKSLGLVVGHARKAMPSSTILSTQQNAITQIGESFVSFTTSAYDAALEHLIGKRVVVEIPRDVTLEEYTGILKEYSANFLEILGVETPMQFTLPLPGPGRTRRHRGVQISRQEGVLKISNQGSGQVEILEISSGEAADKVGRSLKQGESWEKQVEDVGVMEGKIKIRESGELDFILPRSRARVRHRGEIETFNWKVFFGIK